MGERLGQVVDWLIEAPTKGELSERPWKQINWLVEARGTKKPKMSQRLWELVDRLVKLRANDKPGKEGWKVGDWVVKFPSES